MRCAARASSTRAEFELRTSTASIGSATRSSPHTPDPDLNNRDATRARGALLAVVAWGRIGRFAEGLRLGAAVRRSPREAPLGRSDPTRPSSPPHGPPHAGLWCGYDGGDGWCPIAQAGSLLCSPAHPSHSDPNPTPWRGPARCTHRRASGRRALARALDRPERARSGAAPAWSERKPPECTVNCGEPDCLAILQDNQ